MTPTTSIEEAVKQRYLVKAPEPNDLFPQWLAYCRDRSLPCSSIKPHRTPEYCSIVVSWPKKARPSRDIRRTMEEAIGWSAEATFEVCCHECYLPRIRTDTAVEIVMQLIGLYEGEMGAGAWD